MKTSNKGETNKVEKNRVHNDWQDSQVVTLDNYDKKEFGIEDTRLVVYKGKNVDVVIPDGVTHISYDAFEFCNLKSIKIPDSVISIGEYAFYGTTWYNNQPDGVVYAGKVAVGYKGKMPKDTSLVIKEGTVGIADYAFCHCSNMIAVTLPDSLINIGYKSFAECWALKKITIPDKVKNIGMNAFSFCQNLSSVTIGNSVENIGYHAFFCCYSLTTITIPANVTIIEYGAFDYCENLVEVHDKSSLDIAAGSEDNGLVGYYAKNVYREEGESRLTTNEDGCVIYTEGEDKILVKYLGNASELTLPGDITEIYQWALGKNFKIVSIIVPSSVKCIGERAFLWCKRLERIIYQGTMKQWNAIPKGEGWNLRDDCMKVQCLDGDIIQPIDI